MNNNQLNNIIQLSDLVNIQNPENVINEVKIIISMEYPDFDFRTLEIVFYDIVKLFNGKYPGYKGCNTVFHNLSHTLDTLLTMTRIVHGYTIQREKISEKSILGGLISALMHDTGYIQNLDDNYGTGAKYTLQHISRSVLFMEKYFYEWNWSRKEIEFCSNCIWCTNINIEKNQMNFSSIEEEILGKMLGIADLISQIADRIYLEKLKYLYYEFLEGKVQGFSNEFDLLQKTIGFYDMIVKRVDELGKFNKYLIYHFKERWNINQDLYMLSIEKNVNYLKQLIDNKKINYTKYLRRNNKLKYLENDYFTFTFPKINPQDFKSQGGQVEPLAM